MEVWQIGFLALVGCVAGALNVMAGGGSLLAMPVLVFLGLPGPVANGTNRVAVLAQNFTSTVSFFKRGFSDFKLSLSLALAALPGAALGAYLGTKLAGVWFNRILAGIMIGVIVLMARKKGHVDMAASKGAVSGKRIFWAHVLMVGAGIYGGFIQAGVGFIFMAILHRVLRFDLVRVNMHKVFIIGVYTMAALAIFALKGQVAWLGGAALATGNSFGGWVGTRLSVEKGEGLIRIVLYAALTAMAIKLLVTY